MRRLSCLLAVGCALGTVGCQVDFRFLHDAGAGGDRDGGGCASTGCPLSTLRCNVADGRCVECLADVDCPSLSKKRCDPRSHLCVRCLEGSDCADGGVCEATTLNCVRTCQEDNQCSNNVCNQALGLCEECHDASGCQAEPDEPFCQLNRLHCVECVGDTQCGAAEPRCDFRDGHCVECLRQEDCPLAEPVCDIGARICRPSPP